MSRPLARGQIVISGAATSRFLVWSHGPDDAMCLPLGANGVLFGHALTRFRRSSLVVCGVASQDTVAQARVAVSALADRVAAAPVSVSQEARDDILEGDVALTRRGSSFWNGEQSAPGCSWVGPKSGSS